MECPQYCILQVYGKTYDILGLERLCPTGFVAGKEPRWLTGLHEMADGIPVVEARIVEYAVDVMIAILLHQMN